MGFIPSAQDDVGADSDILCSKKFSAEVKTGASGKKEVFIYYNGVRIRSEPGSELTHSFNQLFLLSRANSQTLPIGKTQIDLEAFPWTSHAGSGEAEPSPYGCTRQAKHPTISAIEVLVNGVPKTAAQLIDVGDTVSITVSAQDPQSRPLEYIFRLYKNGTYERDLAYWSTTNTVDYVASASDISTGTSIGIGVRNNDSVDFEGAFYGDAKYSVPLPFSVSIPSISTITAEVNGTAYTDQDLSVGDQLSLSVSASDPESRPLEYTFRLYKNGTYDRTLVPWGTTTSYLYTVASEDVSSASSIYVAVRNDDGIDLLGSFDGDVVFQFNLPFVYKMPTIISSTLLVDGVEHTPGAPILIGSVVTLNIQASDPSSSNLEYVFRISRNGTLAGELQAWSSSNEVSYVAATEDAVADTSIMVGVRNDDGLDLDGFYGDLQHSVSLPVE